MEKLRIETSINQNPRKVSFARAYWLKVRLFRAARQTSLATSQSCITACLYCMRECFGAWSKSWASREDNR